MDLEALTGRILNAAFRVHSVMGPGLLESVYEAALAHELRKAGLRIATQVEVPVVFDGIKLDIAFQADIIAETLIILELKSVGALAPVHSKQLLNYLRLLGLKVGLLLNFNTISPKDQLVRLVG